MLEEQRYLDRLKYSQVKQNVHFDHLDQKFRIPLQQSKNLQLQREQEEAQRRVEALRRYEEQSTKVKSELNKLRGAELSRQIRSNQRKKRDEEAERKDSSLYGGRGSGTI